jgi:replicative DNA helicase
MGRKQNTKRMIGADTNIKINEMNKHNLPYVQYLTQEMKQNKNMVFVDAPRISLEALRLVVTNAVKTRNIEGFVLDYLQLVTGKDSRTTIAEHQENVAQTIAEVCKKENIWCLYSCQINRGGEVRNGDGIMMACDWLYEITPSGLSGSEEAEMIYLKHLATRNFKAADIGDEANPAFKLINGTHFNQL